MNYAHLWRIDTATIPFCVCTFGALQLEVQQKVMVSCYISRCHVIVEPFYILGRSDTLDTERYRYKCYSRYSMYKELECKVGMSICDVISTPGYTTGFIDS